MKHRLSSHTVQTRHTHQMSLLGWGFLTLGVCVLIPFYWIGRADLLIFAYPIVAGLLGAWLYAKQPVFYLGFSLWIWSITPLVRRLIDYQIGEYVSLNLAMVAPLLVSAMTIISIFRYGSSLTKREYIPFLLVIIALLYGYGIGLTKNGLLSSTLALLSWLLPVCTGFHIAVLWKMYPQHQRVIKSTLTWIMLLTGAYGVLQFFSPMPWDTLWMVGSKMQSIGQPEPFQIRVFSTLNSPGPYALVAMSGLILLLGKTGLFARIATGFGMGGFLLSLVRSAWGGWIVALLYMVFRSVGATRKRLMTVLLTTAVVCVPLFFLAPVTNQVNDRMESFSTLEEDNSLLVRLHFMKVAATWTLQDPIGAGIGSVGSSSKLSSGEQHEAFDSGILAVPFTLGWIGAVLYYTALGMLVHRMMKIDRQGSDPFTLVSSAVAIALLSLLFFVNTLGGISGILLWAFLSFPLASERYHEQKEEPTLVSA